MPPVANQKLPLEEAPVPARARLTRWTPLALGPRLTAANRVVIPAMASETATEDGDVTEATVAHYQRLAAARPGMLYVEYTYVHPSGRSEPHQLGAYRDDQVAGLARLAAVIRQAGAIPALQLTHAAGKSDPSLTGGVLMGPSHVTVPAKDRVLTAPRPMTAVDIELWRAAFAAAAKRAAAAGFAVVELHAAHGYGLNQWLSPLTNQRTDSYGGDCARRLRLLLEIIAAIRAAAPSLTLSVRIPGQDHLPGGLTRTEALAIARALIAAGVAVINVSSGLGGWRRPETRRGEGYLVAEAAFIQAGVEAPVIGVGGIESAAYIDAALAARHFQLAAVGRAILKDPAGWAAIHLEKGT